MARKRSFVLSKSAVSNLESSESVWSMEPGARKRANMAKEM